MTAETWKSVFHDCFGGKGTQYYDEVWPILVAVDHGIKPSFLWDVCTPDTSALLSLTRIAYEKQLLTEKLRVVELDLDVFIVNVSALITVLTKILTSDDSWLVDISESEPKIPSKDTHYIYRNHLLTILSQLGISDSSTKPLDVVAGLSQQQLSSNSDIQISPGHSRQLSHNETQDKAITIMFPEDVNLSTIFGCMLGYPQIYWWQGSSGENSLSGVPLKVFKFGATFAPKAANIELFSFSIPEALENELRPGIERWGNVMNIYVEKSSLYSDTNFVCDQVLCLSVAL